MKITILVLVSLLLASTAMCAVHKIPFRVDRGAVFVDGTLNGDKVVLLVDSGATHTQFLPKLRPKKAGEDPPITLFTGTGRMEGFLVNSTLLLGDVVWEKRVVYAKFDFPNFDGILGLDFFRQFNKVTFDFLHGQLVLED